MFLEISEKYMKLFLSILYLTEMETLTYDIKDIIPKWLLSVYLNSEMWEYDHYCYMDICSYRMWYFEPLCIMKLYSVHDH